MYPCRQNNPNICPCFFLYFVDVVIIWTHYPHVPWNHVLQFPSTGITPAEEGRTDRPQLLLLLSSANKLFVNSADVLVIQAKLIFSNQFATQLKTRQKQKQKNKPTPPNKKHKQTKPVFQLYCALLVYFKTSPKISMSWIMKNVMNVNSIIFKKYYMAESYHEAIRTMLTNNNDCAPIPGSTCNPFTMYGLHFSKLSSKIYSFLHGIVCIFFKKKITLSFRFKKKKKQNNNMDQKM